MPAGNRVRLACLIISAAVAASLGLSAAPSDTDIEARVSALLAKMTLEEKLGQLQQLDGEANGQYRPEHLDLAAKGLLGSTLNVRGAKRVNELQRMAVEKSRLKIPILFAFDVIHGYRTVFPVPLAEAASWDPAAVERAAAIAAAEAWAAGLRWTFAPMVDIARDARWGRIVEGAGEDPYLGAAMARARVRGFQGDDFSQPYRVVACAKHWVAYGAAEQGRDYNTTDVSERVLRDVYFPPFKAAVDAGVGTFMSAFNDLSGIPASANPFTLTRVLREEWKWDGLVVSDYNSVLELMAHGLAATEDEAAEFALEAGVDMEMISRLYNKHGPALVKSGRLSMATIDEAVRRVLRLKMRAGIFDRPYADETVEASVMRNPKHIAEARAIAARSMVLLKNDGNVLPLAPTVKRLAVIGALADDKVNPLGSWTGDGRPEDTVTVLQGIKEAGGTGLTVEYARGCEVPCPDDSGFAQAVAAARSADATVLVVGESADMSGEAASRSSLDLPGRQLDLVKAVHGTGKPLVVVLMNGRPLSIPWIAENVPAILEAWFPGSEAGHAIADVLFGKVSPGGKLPVSFPHTVGQEPFYYNHKNTGRPPSKERYTSRFIDVPWTPVFPFGHGLSYTTFRISNLALDSKQIPPDGQVKVSVDLENTGAREGDEVVQLYIRDEAASVTQPVKELKGFERITLKPGERRRVTFTLGPEHLGIWAREMRYAVEPGWFQVMVGSSSADGLSDRFQVVVK